MNLPDVDAVILCGGLGTRLRPVIADGQKTMTDVGGRPFLGIVVDWLRSQGSRRIVFCCGHRAKDVEAYFLGRFADAETIFSVEPVPLGTAGALKNAENFLKSDTILLVNGDSFCPIDLDPLLERHLERRAAVTIVTVEPESRRDGGYLRADGSGRVTSFAEKAFFEGAALNAGIYLIERSVLADIPRDKPASLEKETFPSLLTRGVFTHPAHSPLFDIGTPERLVRFREVQA